MKPTGGGDKWEGLFVFGHTALCCYCFAWCKYGVVTGQGIPGKVRESDKRSRRKSQGKIREFRSENYVATMTGLFPLS